MKHVLCAAALAVCVGAGDAPAQGEPWITWESVDRMTGEREVHGVLSAPVIPEGPLQYPYDKIFGTLSIYCNGLGMLIFGDGYGGAASMIVRDAEPDIFHMRARFDEEDVTSLTVVTIDIIADILFIPGKLHMMDTPTEFGRLLVELEPVAGGIPMELNASGIPTELNAGGILDLAEGHGRLLLEVPARNGNLYLDFRLDSLIEKHRESCG